MKNFQERPEGRIFGIMAMGKMWQKILVAYDTKYCKV